MVLTVLLSQGGVIEGQRRLRSWRCLRLRQRKESDGLGEREGKGAS